MEKYIGLVCLLLVAAFAEASGVSVEDAWVRATPPGARTGAAYFVLRNNGVADRLIGVKSPAAAKSEIHTHVADGGMMRMQHVPVLDIAAGSDVEFGPGGLHVMLMGLRAPLRAGEELVLSLVFEHAGEVEVTIGIVDARKEVQ
ncbi:MAG: copper chaperone PCu(A)C [Woeseia sp.]